MGTIAVKGSPAPQGYSVDQLDRHPRHVRDGEDRVARPFRAGDRAGAAHDCPAKPVDVPDEAIPCRVPPNPLGALATVDGRLVADRPRGPLTAHGASGAGTIPVLDPARKLGSGATDAVAARDAPVAAAQIAPAKVMAAGTMPDAAATPTSEARQEGGVSDPDTAMILPPGGTQ